MSIHLPVDIHSHFLNSPIYAVGFEYLFFNVRLPKREKRKMKGVRKKGTSPLNTPETTSAGVGGACNNRERCTNNVNCFFACLSVVWSSSQSTDLQYLEHRVLLPTPAPASYTQNTCIAACHSAEGWEMSSCYYDKIQHLAKLTAIYSSRLPLELSSSNRL